MQAADLQVGDELIIACEPADAVVAKIAHSYVFIRWPWRELDQTSRAKWDGTVALPRIESSQEWGNTPWRVEPSSGELKVGDSCMVGIPPTRVIVRNVKIFDPPRSLGWLPKPTAGADVVEVGRQDDEEAGYMIYLDGAEPISFERP